MRHQNTPRRAARGAILLLALACSGDPTTPEPNPTPTPVASIIISPGTQALASLGVTTTLTAELRAASGAVITNQPVTWTRRGTGATTVSATGVVTAVANGVDTVVATSGTASGIAVVTVQQVAASLALTTPVQNFQLLGNTATITAALRDANNRPLTGALVTWASSDPAAVFVDQFGNVTAAGPGTATITATSGTATAQVAMGVTLTSPVGGPLLGATVPCAGGMAGPFPCQGIELLAFLPVSGVGGGAGIDLNDIWGWTDPANGKEYAIVLRRNGAAFVDVSVPTRPVYLGQLPITPGATPNVWHDVKVYQNHAYIVADGAGPHGMQVFDLTRLRAHAGVPRTFAADFTYQNINSAHNIFINEATGFAYIVGASGGGTTCAGGLHMVDIRTPKVPVFAGCYADAGTGRAGTGYTHDVQCVIYTGPDAAYQGREVCFGSNETHLSIADLTTKTAPRFVSRATYPQVSYTHQGWLTADQRYFLINDELDEQQRGLPGTRTLIWDVEDLDDPILVGQFLGPNPATDHNHYIRGTRMYASTYQFGLRVVDVSNPRSPVAAGFFDTAPNLANVPGFGGSWSNYPFFPSGIIVMTSGTEGFFVLRMP